MEEVLMNIDENDVILIRLALSYYMDFLESDNSVHHPLIQQMIYHCDRLHSNFDEFVKRNK